MKNNQYTTYAVGSDNNWGWGADLTYHFPGDGRDVTLAFAQLNTSNSDSVAGLSSLFATGAVLNQAFTVNGKYNSAEGGVDTNYDAADLTFGQIIAVGSRITLHPFAGVRYAYIDYTGTGTYTQLNTTLVPSVNPPPVQDLNVQTLTSTFKGAGPRFGSDAAVNLGSGFSLRSTLGVSLLVGSMDVEKEYNSSIYSYNTINGINQLISVTDTDNGLETNTRVVPEADAKLAAAYHSDFNNGCGLGLEVGYQVTSYFDAIQNGAISTIDSSTDYTDFFMQGPYARIQLDVA